MKIQPRGKWVLVQPEEVTNTSTKGLVIPDSVEKEQKAYGKVLEVGEKVEGIKKGMTVLYGVYAGEEIKIKSSIQQKEKIDYKLLHDDDILAILI